MPVKNSNMPTVDWVHQQTPGALGKHHGILDNLPQVSSFHPFSKNSARLAALVPGLLHPAHCPSPHRTPAPPPLPALPLASAFATAPHPPPLPLLAATTASHPAPGTGRINFTLSLTSVPYTGP